MARRRDLDTMGLGTTASGDYTDFNAPVYEAPAPYQSNVPPTGMPNVAVTDTRQEYPSYQPGSGSLFGFDATKLASPTHMLESPKYAFANVMQNYGNTQEGFQEGFKALQAQYPQFFSNWEITGDDSIRWNGQGSLADAFQGHDSFDVWQNASGEGGGPGPWQWATNREDLLPPDQRSGFQTGMGSLQGALQGSSGGGYGGSAGGGSYTQSNPYADEIMQQLRGLFPDGAFNQQVVNRRVDNVRDTLNKQRQSRLSTNQALLADRGLIGSGPEGVAQANLEDDLYGTFTGAVNDIYANESENADKRMMQALSLATGMSLEQASQYIDMFRAQTDRDLGFGNLALGNKEADNSFNLGLGNLALGNSRAANDYNLGLANYGLDRDTLQWQIGRGQNDDVRAA